jgi:hypothetical protein
MTRQEIENNYTMLKELKDMEKFIANHDKMEKKQWMKITTPNNEYIFLNSDSQREAFVEYVVNRIDIMRKLLNLESEESL